MMFGQLVRLLLLCGLLIGSALAPISPAHILAAPEQDGEAIDIFLTVNEGAQGAVIQFQTVGAANAASVLDQFETEPFQGYLLPVSYVTLLVVDDVQAASLDSVQFDSLETVAWHTVPEKAPQQTPPALDWDSLEKVPVDESMPQLPTAPVFAVRQGRIRGHTVRVLAVSPIFQENGKTRMAVDFRLSVPGTRPLTGGISELMAAGSVKSAAADESLVAAESDLSPSNGAAALSSAKILVRRAGMQMLTGAQLAATGINLSDVSQLALDRRGQPVALDVMDTNGDGALNKAESIRFYSAHEGDYWNRDDIYWLVREKTGAVRMSSRSVSPGGARDGVRTTALETGEWRDNSIRFSLYPGQDSDHWYAARLRVDAGVHTEPALHPRVTAKLPLELPPTGGAATLTPGLNTTGRDSYTVRVATGGESQTETLDSAGTSIWQQVWQPELDFDASGASVEIILVPDDNVTTLLVDSLVWELPVKLDFKGGSAGFMGVDGTWLYELANQPDSYWLYDITDPLQPLSLSGASDAFQDGPQAAKYLLVDSASLQTPDVTAHTPISFGPGDGADAVYIAPAQFHAELSPLVADRKTQGYVVKVVDVQAIYDAWSYGYMAPEAIRSYLRYMVANGKPAPISAVLVGDGTYDPMGYEGNTSANHIPPYLKTYVYETRYVDPWLGQVGCENCFAQLDGEDPLDNPFEQPPGEAFFPDIYIGRLSVNSADQLETVVAKIVDYEIAPDAKSSWRSSSLWLADNYILPGSTPDNIRRDAAGDFAQASEQIVALLPPQAQPDRVYFGPPNPQPAPGDLPILPEWHEPDADLAHDRTVDLMSSGPGLVTAFTHSNHWQWAATASNSSTPYLFSVVDVAELSNRDQLFVGLSMTCYTSQFYRPSNFGTLDERLLLHPDGGAAAVWGPAGLSVAYGHDKLQIGFHTELWKAEPFSATLGQLAAAGYYELFANSFCCHDVRRTFLILGDPLTRVRVRADQNFVYLPISAKQ